MSGFFFTFSQANLANLLGSDFRYNITDIDLENILLNFPYCTNTENKTSGFTLKKPSAIVSQMVTYKSKHPLMS